MPVSPAEFAGTVDGALGGYRGWTANGALRMQHVPGDAGSNFTVPLAQPWTAYSLCLSIGIDIRIGGVPFTNCQAGNSIVINADRYLGGVGGYGAPLSVYRAYVVNHEVGNGWANSTCRARAAASSPRSCSSRRSAWRGCAANAWPTDVPAPPERGAETPSTPAPRRPPPHPTPLHPHSDADRHRPDRLPRRRRSSAGPAGKPPAPRGTPAGERQSR